MSAASAHDPLWLGRALVAGGAITPEQFASARLLWLRPPRQEFPAVLERLGLASPVQIAAALAGRHNLPLADSAARPPDRTAGRLISREAARRKGLVPLRRENGRLELAVADPGAYGAEEAARDFPGEEVSLQVAPRADILGVIEETWRPDAPPGNAQERFEGVVREAISEGATDIHLDPRERHLEVRLRIDGRLIHHCFVEDPLREPFVQAAKLAGRLDIAERRLPQDGRGAIAIGSRRCHLRFSCIPAASGESVVIRVLDEAAAIRPLESLELSDADRAHIDGLLALPHGLVYVTGPTGAGKTTLLYSLIGGLPQTELHARKIVTLEEPVELRHPRFFLQLEVDERIGRGFSELLRHVLRHDPDVVLVGETRDRPTAEITLRAALAGRLCLSTLHTNSALGAVARLTEMGLDPVLLAAALKGVLAQRLVRRPCPSCRRPHPQSDEWLRRFAAVLKGAGPDAGFVAVETGRPCPVCRGRGYRGRIPIIEIVPLAGFERLIASRAEPESLLAAARERGCRTLFEDGVRKAARGLATLEDICAAVESPAR
ncbi:MAG: GspE/PulE family protein [Opitutaceae bacterium]